MFDKIAVDGQTWLLLAGAALVLAGVVLVATVYLSFFCPRKKHAFLLRYEDSRIFSPFVVAELYCNDYTRLRWVKLRALLAFFGLFLGFLLSSAVVIWSLWHGRVSPLWALASLLFSLLLLVFCLWQNHRLSHYYRQSSFYQQTAISEAELRGGDGASKGMRGEYYAWRLFQDLPQPRYILISPIVPKPKGSFAEIDLVVLTRKGIFCVEAKNRDGMFLTSHYTDLKGQWRHVQSAKDGQKVRISNIESPLVQNQHHIWTLANFWRIDSKYFFNVLCFGEQADLKRAMPAQSLRLSGEGSFLYYGERAKLHRQVSSLPDILGASLIERLYQELSSSCKMSRVRREAMLSERQAQWAQRRFSGRRQRRGAGARGSGDGRSRRR